MRKAFIGDIHGSIEELEKLHSMLQHYSLDAIEHCGDLVDRGPDSGAVIQFCRERKMGGVMGNHDSVILEYAPGGTRFPKIPKNPDKARTLESITRDPADVAYLRQLPLYKIHQAGDRQLLHVHAGLHPFVPLEQQGLMFCTASLVHPTEVGKTRWMVVDKKGIPEEEHRKNGWFRWYEQYALPYDVVVGHRSLHGTKGEAEKFLTLSGTNIYFVDTGAWFYKNLTALIWPDEIFVSTNHGEYKLP